MTPAPPPAAVHAAAARVRDGTADAHDWHCVAVWADVVDSDDLDGWLQSVRAAADRAVWLGLLRGVRG